MDAANNAETTHERPADLAPSSARPRRTKRREPFRAHRSADIFSHINKRVLSGKRTMALVQCYLDQLGHPTGVDIQARILAAAELQVLAEQARFAALENPPTADAIDQIVRLEAAAGRAQRKLGLDKPLKKSAGGLGDALLHDLEAQRSQP
jgi:hypothetical protein